MQSADSLAPSRRTCTIPARDMIDLRYGTRRPFRNKKAGAGPVLSVRLVAGKGGGGGEKTRSIEGGLEMWGGRTV